MKQILLNRYFEPPPSPLRKRGIHGAQEFESYEKGYIKNYS